MPSFGLNDVLASDCLVPECDAATLEDAPFPICTNHYVAIVRHFNQTVRASGYVADEVTRMYVGGTVAPEPEPPPMTEATSYVYFIRFRDRVKIGTTYRLLERLGQLPVDEVIAVIPGDRSVEREWHDRYSAQRVRGEWFRMTPTMMSTIKALGIAS